MGTHGSMEISWQGKQYSYKSPNCDLYSKASVMNNLP